MDDSLSQKNSLHSKKTVSLQETVKGIWRWLVVIFLVAMAYRGLYFLEVRQHPLFLNPVIDAEQHHAWAQRVSSGLILGRGPDDVFKPCLYPLLLGGVYYLFGPNITVIQWFQFILGSVSAALTALLGAILMGKRLGIIAGFVCALYAPFLFFEGQLLTPALSVFLNLTLTLMLLRSSPSWGKIGLLGGVSAGVRPDVLAPLILVCGYRFWTLSRAEEYRKVFVKFVLLVSGFLTVAIPVMARNYALTGQWVFFSSNAGINFYTGNGPNADGLSAIPTGLAWEQAISTVPKDIMHRPASTSRLWFSRGLHAIGQDPAAWLKLLGKKALAFFNGLEFRNNIGYNYFREDIAFLGIPFIQYWPVSALALLGMVLCLVRQWRIREMILIFLWITGYLIVGLAFFVTARFRISTVPFMVISAIWALNWLCQKSIHSAKAAVQSALLVVLLMGVTWPGWFDAVKGASSRDHINQGNVFRKNGETRKALIAYKKAYSLNAKDPEGWFLAGTVHLNSGRPDQALEHLTRAAEQCPQGVDIMLNLANAHFMKGDVDKAESYYKALIELNRKINLYHKRTSVAKAHIGLQRLYHGQGKVVEAEKEMEYAWKLSDQVAAEYSVINGLALKRSSEAFERLASEEAWNWYPRANLGIAYLKMGQFEKAAMELERAVRMRGALPGVSFHLGLALIKAGRIEEGKEVLERLLSRLPENSLRRRVQGLLNSI